MSCILFPCKCNFHLLAERRRIKREELLAATVDGFYAIRTDQPAECLPVEDAVRSYKNLARVERAFRSTGRTRRMRQLPQSAM